MGFIEDKFNLIYGDLSGTDVAELCCSKAIEK
jgi:hypothetical protein